MKAYVITILDNKRSVESAERCIESGKRFGVNVEKAFGITPQNTNIKEYIKKLGINPAGFNEKYSRTENATAAFLSHMELWRLSLKLNEPILILEHDAIFVGPIPNITFKGCINLGKPSYGKYNDPRLIGVNPLTSKQYFPGAHGYMVNPWGALKLVSAAKTTALPTDVFLHKQLFPWLEEYYPWPIEAHDTFTTIQNEVGCRAKHNYGPNYEII